MSLDYTTIMREEVKKQLIHKHTHTNSRDNK